MAHLDLPTATFAAADAKLGGRDSRRIGHNTTLERRHRRGDGSRTIAVRYHATDIVTFSADGWLTINTGGWDTVTTWQRIGAILPLPWRVWSRNGSRMLYHNQRPITPYADGLSLHPASGAVGMYGDILLAADDVATIEAAADAAEASRAATRAARLLREHPTVNGPRTHTRSLYDQRPRDCERCTVELVAEREARRTVLAADHAASDIAAAGGPDTWAVYNGAHKNYRDKRECPWECPDRPRSW